MRLLPRHGHTLGSLGDAPVRFEELFWATGVADLASGCPLLAVQPSPEFRNYKGAGRVSLLGDRLAGTKPPTNPREAWEEAAVIRLVILGTALSSWAEDEEHSVCLCV